MGLEEQKREWFAAHGWVVVRGLIGRERVKELEGEVDAMRRAWPEAPAGEVWEVPGVSKASAVIAAHARDREVGRQAAAALGCARVQLLQDTVLVKAPRLGGEVAWHQDHTYTGYLEPARVVSVRLALTDDDEASGCLEVIDGSHAWGLLGDVRALSEPSVADALGPEAARWAERVVRIELEPGDVSIHHCLLLHCSKKNRTERARKTLITRLFDAECRVALERLPEGAAAHFPVDGERRASEAAFPVVFP